MGANLCSQENCSGEAQQMQSEFTIQNLSPPNDGTTVSILSTRSNIILGYKEGHLHIINSETKEIRGDFDHFMPGAITHICNLRSMIYTADSQGNVKSVKLSECNKPFQNYGPILKGPASAMTVYRDHVLVGDESGYLTIIDGKNHEVLLQIAKPMQSKITNITCYDEYCAVY